MGSRSGFLGLPTIKGKVSYLVAAYPKYGSVDDVPEEQAGKLAFCILHGLGIPVAEGPRLHDNAVEQGPECSGVRVQGLWFRDL